LITLVLARSNRIVVGPLEKRQINKVNLTRRGCRTKQMRILFYVKPTIATFRMNTGWARSAVVLLLWSVFLAGINASAAKPTNSEKRPISVSDVIEMTRLSRGPIFSPDGRRFLLVLKKGNIVENTNEFSLLLYQSTRALASPKATVLVSMASSSNRDGISHVRWLSDSERIVFLGENPRKSPQVYEVDAETHRVRAITSHGTAVTDYDISANGDTLLFAADPRNEVNTGEMQAIDRRGLVVDGHYLFDLLARNFGPSSPSQQIFIQRPGNAPVQVSIDDRYFVGSLSRMSLSPDGRYGVIGAALRTVPDGWERYQDRVLQEHLTRYASDREAFTRHIFPCSTALLLVTATGSLEPVVNAPVVGHYGQIFPVWSTSSQSVFLRTYLPLEGAKIPEGKDPTTQQFAVEVGLPSRNIRIVGEDDWPSPARSNAALEVTTVQGVNDAPKIYVSDSKEKQRVLLLDLNPQFSELTFGKVEIITFKLRNKIEVRCGLYLPPGYDQEKRYPLVIQTHGFYSKGFSMDGSFDEWSSAFAARPLAARGLMVLQVWEFVNEYDHDHYNDDHSFGLTDEQAGRNVNVAAIEGAIKYLDDRGEIAADKVGIVGFSRTVGVVEYMLTHSDAHFAAASLVDGIDYGYFQLIAFPYLAWDVESINGGVGPFGAGLKTWITESPSFSLDKISAPVRLLALNPVGALSQWECYAGLVLQDKPVDFVLIADPAHEGGNHFVVKPWERRIAQEGLVDWFCFWLKNEEDGDPQKVGQYERWRQLRNLQPRDISSGEN
jgi:WD40 repeat protein